MNFTHNSKKKAWSTIKKLNTEKGGKTRVTAVTLNQVASQLLGDLKPTHKDKGKLQATKLQTKLALQETSHEFEPFTYTELDDAMTHLKI